MSTAIGGFVVTGRPPGTISYERRMRSSKKHARNAGKTQTVVRKRRVVAAHEHPYFDRDAAEQVRLYVETMGWTDVKILADGKEAAPAGNDGATPR
jgi:hypothetical protein